AFHTYTTVAGSVNAIYGLAGTPNEEGGWEDFCTEIHFFNKFPEGKRKEITFHTEFKKSDGTIVPWQSSVEQKPFFGKFRMETNNTWRTSLPLHMIRYAHVLLVYAEAQARSAGPNEDDYRAPTAGRERAALEPLSARFEEHLINRVVDERAWEFAGETTRWFDLVRLELVEEANANKDVNDLKPIGAITRDDYTFPIPFDDVTINPNLY